MKRATIKHHLNRMVDRRRLLARVEQAILTYAREHGVADDFTNYYLTPARADRIRDEALLRGDQGVADDCRLWLQMQPRKED